MLTRRGSSTYGSALPPSPPLPGLTLTCGLSPTNSIGTTRQCFLSNITGRKHVQRISHINSSGIKWTKKCETRTTSTGLSTSHSLLQHYMFFSLLEILLSYTSTHLNFPLLIKIQALHL